MTTQIENPSIKGDFVAYQAVSAPSIYTGSARYVTWKIGRVTNVRRNGAILKMEFGDGVPMAVAGWQCFTLPEHQLAASRIFGQSFQTEADICAALKGEAVAA